MSEKATVKEFEIALSDYGDAAKGGNVSMMEKNRVALIEMAGFKAVKSNSPANSKPSATPEGSEKDKDSDE